MVSNLSGLSVFYPIVGRNGQPSSIIGSLDTVIVEHLGCPFLICSVET